MRTLLSLLTAFFLLHAPALHAQPLPREVKINGVEFVLIPEGWFWYTVHALDIAQHTDERPRYRSAKVWLDSYYMAKYEARARDLQRFMHADGPSQEARDGIEQHRKATEGDAQYWDVECTLREMPDGRYALRDTEHDLPATNLSWHMADEFARWMGFRLPTEAEWQKAARGTDKRIFPWGDDPPDDTYAVFAWVPRCRPAPVDSFPKGVSPYGLHHMAGNVAELVADWYNWPFDVAIRDGVRNPPPAQTGSPVPWLPPVKIIKGGHWSQDALGHSIALRRLVRPHAPSSRHGVRFAVDPATVQKLVQSGNAEVMKQ